MQIQITGKHMEVTDAIRHYIEEKMGRLDKNAYSILDAHVTLSVEKYRQIVDVLLQTNRTILRVSGENKDMYASIDLVVDKLQKKLQKDKEKLKAHKAREPHLEELIARAEFEEDVPSGFSFFLQKIEAKPMDIDEARMQLDVLGYAFYMFRRVGTDVINIIHKTKHGEYVILEPENV